MRLPQTPDKVGHGEEGYYYGENGEHTWYSISRAIGEALVSFGISKDPEPTSFTDDELIKYYGSLVCPFVQIIAQLI